MVTQFRYLREGDKGVVRGYRGADGYLRKKLLAMGLTRNTRFSVIRRAPLGDPVEIELRGFRIFLRESEAGIIEFTVEDQD